jgi:predicted transcriptional regulator
MLPHRQGRLLGHDLTLRDLLPPPITPIDLLQDHTLTILPQRRIRLHWPMLHKETLKLPTSQGRLLRDAAHPEMNNLITSQMRLDLTSVLLHDQGPLETAQICQALLQW